jgi:hypothetical protein
MEKAYDKLIRINKRVKQEYTSMRFLLWQDSPFGWLLSLPPRSVGAAAERLVEELLKEYGFDIQPSGTSDFDRWCGIQEVDKRIRLEIKFSTLWENDIYVFQQIRNQNYQYLFCLGISPFAVHAWVIPKEIAWQNATPQHGGKAGQDTKWIRVSPLQPPEWLNPYGGDVDTAIIVLRKIFEQ